MTRNPIFVTSDSLAIEALQKMAQGNNIIIIFLFCFFFYKFYVSFYVILLLEVVLFDFGFLASFQKVSLVILIFTNLPPLLLLGVEYVILVRVI